MYVRKFLLTELLSASLMLAATLANSAQAERPVLTLDTVFPLGIAAGSSVEITLTGKSLDGLRQLLCNAPGFRCDVVDTSHCRVFVPADTPPGFYDLWAVGEFGVSAPRTFCVSRRSEQLETDPNDSLSTAMASPINSVINGKIEPAGDVDHFRFSAQQGQRVVIECLAERINSRLRAVLEIFDADGKRLAVNRGYYGIDPLIDFHVPSDGDYIVKVHDLISSGGAEYSYRLEIDTGPRVAFSTPNLVSRGQASRITLHGWNLPARNAVEPVGGTNPVNEPVSRRVAGELDQLEVDIPASFAQESWPLAVRLLPAQVAVAGFTHHFSGGHVPVVIGVTDLPVAVEQAGNQSSTTAQRITLPCEVSGRLVGGDERDWYAFTAARGEVIYFDVQSQRLGAPTDLQLGVFDAAGEIVLCEFNDEIKNLGGTALPTNHLDPSGRWVAPADGTYLLMIRNLIGGLQPDPRRTYRLSLRREEPDFQLVMIPSGQGLNVARGGRITFDVLALRERSMQETIRITAKNLPPGIECPDVCLGPGVDRVTMAVSADQAVIDQVFLLNLEGVAESVGRRPVRGSTVVRSGTPNGWSRLTSQMPLAVSGDAPARATAAVDNLLDHHLYGKLRLRYAPGSVIDVAVEVARTNPNHQPAAKLIGTGLPAMIRNVTAVIPAGEQRGHLSFYLPPTLPVGSYSMAVSVETTVSTPDGKTEAVTLVSNPVSFDVEPAMFTVDVDPFAVKQVKRGETVQLKYSVARCNGFIGKIHTELAVPGVVTNVPGLRGRGETFVGQSDRGSLQIVVNEDAPLGPQPFLRLFSVGVREDQPVFHGAVLFPVEIVE